MFLVLLLIPEIITLSLANNVIDILLQKINNELIITGYIFDLIKKVTYEQIHDTLLVYILNLSIVSFNLIIL